MENIKNVLTEEEIRAKVATISRQLTKPDKRLSKHKLPQWPELNQQ